jgi:hypothetical protein
MTMMQGREAAVGAHHADELVEELNQLREADAQLREELVEVRRQRDEAISQSQWLILRVSNAEQAIDRLQAELIEARSKRGVTPESVEQVAPVDEAPDAPVDEAPEVEDVQVEDATDAPDVEISDSEVPSLPTPAEAVTPVAIVPGSWAGQAGPWLPPDEAADDGSTAHEFAALTERALAVEAAEAEEAAAAMPAPVEMNVLPEATSEPRKATFFRRR